MFRFPDKPAREISRQHLDTMEALGCYFCTLKIDGWRCVVTYDGGRLTYQSCSGKPLEVKEAVRLPFEKELSLEMNGMPITLDCEMTGNRREGDVNDIMVLEVIEIAGGPMYSKPAYQRHQAALSMFASRTVPACGKNFSAFFDFHRANRLAEGVVLKRKDAHAIWSTVDNAKNPGLIKCKWRSGSSGVVSTSFKE